MRNLLFGIALATLAGISDANAQGYPTRSVTAIVPASAGGPTDTIARIVMQRAQQFLGQFIPFRGSAPALQQVIGGQLDIIIDQASSALSIVKGGNVRAYAVTAPQRLASAPDLPTVDEAGLQGFYVSIWQGVWAPKGTPKETVARLNGAIAGALADPAVQKRLSEVGQELPTKEQMTPEGFGAFHKAEMDKWTPIIKAANIKPEGT